MAGNGGSGTLNPPSDDDVAPVIPLRQRQATLAPSAPRRVLPRERAAFDPELEPGEVALTRRSLGLAGRPRLRLPHRDVFLLSRRTRSAIAIAAGAVVLLGLWAVVLAARPGAGTHPPQYASTQGSGVPMVAGMAV